MPQTLNLQQCSQNCREGFSLQKEGNLQSRLQFVRSDSCPNCLFRSLSQKQNVVSYVDQIDRLHGFLTVKETLDFAFNCRYGGTHRGAYTGGGPDVDKLVKEMDEDGWLVDIVLRAIGLKRVEDTFVGNDKVRGVSGEEKKRVTVGEMMSSRAFVDCFDEIR